MSTMKKYLLYIVLTLAMAASFNESAKAQFYLGGKIGGTSSSLTGIGLKSFQPTPKMYLNGGLLANLALGKRFALELEFNYSGKGSAIQYYGEYQTWRGQIKMEQKLHYFAIPLMLQFKFGDRHNYFHLDAGVVSNTLIGSKFNGTITVEQQNGDIEEYPMDLEFNPLKSDFGYAFGFGMMASGFIFDFRYEIGTKTVYQTEPDSPEVYNRAFMITVGYMIDLL